MYGKENDQTHGSDDIFCNKRPETYEWAVYTIIKFQFDNGVNRKLIHMFLAFYYKKYTSLPCVWSFSLPYTYLE